MKVLLPERYQERYEEVRPEPMGSAGLKFAEDGRVAWDEIWGSFCDLAMAGGPPHKGRLLAPGTAEEIAGQPERYREVVDEICRGIAMVTKLTVGEAEPGWVRVECFDAAMAGWLLRAITMENVACRSTGCGLDLPAGPAYRLEKEVKNVITVIAKTCHYWRDHMWPAQHRAIGELFAELERETPLVQPGPADWVGVECGDVRSAIRAMRGLVASNVLARREGTVVLAAGECSGRAGECVAAAGLRLP